MGKPNGKSNKRAKASTHIDFESDNEELRDEVDKFHDDARRLKKNAIKKTHRKKVEEVLNVEGDLSDDSIDDGNESSDFDEADHKGALSDKWGKKRNDFYGADYVDEDWGGMRDEEMEDAELEEVDALGRQRALDTATNNLSDLFADEQKEKEEKPQVVKETPFEWKFANVKKLNKNSAELVEEYQRRKDLMAVIVEPLAPAIKALPKDSALRRQLLMCVDVYSSYILNLMMYLKMKSDSLAEQKHSDSLLESHPINEEILRLKKMIEKVDMFLEENSRVINLICKMVEEGEDLNELGLPAVSVPKKNKKNVVEPAPVAEIENDENVADVPTDGKRLASDLIALNKSVVKSGKKKKDRHAKLANRNKYKEISKRVKSQIGVIRKETTKYSGEARGIRASTIKSTKLLA